jgi:hypothetical protein
MRKMMMKILLRNMTMNNKMMVTLMRKNTCKVDTKKLIHHEVEAVEGVEAEVEEEEEEEQDKI